MDIGISVICCSIVYTLLLCIVYFSKERIVTIETKVFDIILASNFLGLILELLCCFTGPMRENIPILNEIINRLFLTYFVVFISTFTIYMYITSRDLNNKKISELSKIKLRNFYLLFIIICIVLVCVLPLNYYDDGNTIFSYGASTNFIYGLCLIHIIVDFYFLIKNRKTIRIKKVIPLLALIFCLILVFIIRIINPNVILITAAFSLVTAIMYFTIENPDLKIINQLNLAKKAAEKASRTKSDFLSSMSHEIRTPLNAIVGLSENIAKYEQVLPKEVAEDAKDILIASNTLLEIVGNILDINKIENEKMDMDLVAYDPREMIEVVTRLAKTRIGNKPIKLIINIAQDLPTILIGDKNHLQQVINNLLSNAIKYTDNGTVTLTVKCLNNKNKCRLFISVQDTGRGIRKEDISKIFNKFERLDIEKNSTTEGTGLGLAITKKLVNLMGGKISVRSEYQKGTLFIVELKQDIALEQKWVVNTELINTVAVMENRVPKKKILIVDDNLLNIKVAKKILEDHDFIIDECLSGEECLKKVNNNNYDLILMDIMMPNLNGIDTLKKLKEDIEFTTPVIALTADAISGAQEKYLNAGFSAYLAKPFTKDEIIKKVDVVLNNKINWQNVPIHVFGENK